MLSKFSKLSGYHYISLTASAGHANNMLIHDLNVKVLNKAKTCQPCVKTWCSKV